VAVIGMAILARRWPQRRSEARFGCQPNEEEEEEEEEGEKEKEERKIKKKKRKRKRERENDGWRDMMDGRGIK